MGWEKDLVYGKGGQKDCISEGEYSRVFGWYTK